MSDKKRGFNANKKRKVSHMKYLKFIGFFVVGIILGGVISFFIIKNDVQHTLDYQEALIEHYKEQKLEVREDEIESGEDNADTIQENPTYQVTNLKEFVEALGHDRIIEITEPLNITKEIADIVPLDSLKFVIDGALDSGSISSKYESKFYDVNYSVNLYYRNREEINLPNDYVGYSLTVKNTRNLTIKGLDDIPTEIIIQNRDSQVLGFQNNEHLTIQKLRVYHDLPVEHDCGINAPVLKFYQDKYIKIEECFLNGSGTEGINASEVNILEVSNTKIHNCSDTAIELYKVGYFEFNDGYIIDNNLNSCLFKIYSDTKIVINNTTIANNTTGRLFNSYIEEPNISFYNCFIHHNNIDVEGFSFDETNKVYSNKFDSTSP